MTRFKIKMARIETARDGGEVRVTFQIERGALHFQLPIRLSAGDYDDTEIVQAARATLHRTFVELAAQSLDWERSMTDLQQLSGMSRRPKSLHAKPVHAKSLHARSSHGKSMQSAGKTSAKYLGKTKLSNK
jgi:hypothetical protein